VDLQPLSPAALRSPVLARLRVWDTGRPPEPTGAVVAWVRERRADDPRRWEGVLARLGEAAAALRRELEAEREDPPLLRELLRSAQSGLEELGVVPSPVRELVRRIEAEGGAAKISGAGSLAGPGAGVLLVYDPDPDRAAGWRFLSALQSYSMRLGAPGLRLEEIG
jgi:mevalonate kinase